MELSQTRVGRSPLEASAAPRAATTRLRCRRARSLPITSSRTLTFSASPRPCWRPCRRCSCSP
eukprot:2292802-Prymnesium_polylepis.1